MRARRVPRAVAGVLLAGAAVGLGGCDRPPPQADKGEAVALLRAALEAWQAGEKPDALQARTPPVVAVDPAWLDGTKLVKFEIDEGGAEPSGYDLSCPVKLWLGTRPPVKVRFVVALAPNKVITREVGG